MAISKIDANSIDSSTVGVWTNSSNNISYTAGAVGIGVAASSGTPLKIGRVDSSSEGGQIDLCRSTDNSSIWGIDVYGNTSTPSLRILDNGAAAVRIQIDGSGRVTMPYQPMFEAALSASPHWQVATGVVPFNNILQNTGNHFNTSTYKFTAPVAGLYYFGFQGYFGLTAGHCRVIHLYWQVNDSNSRHCPQCGGTTGTGPGYEYHPTLTASQVFKLSANDTVRMYVNGIDFPGGGTPKFYSDTRFYGYLIG
jgi:hypothetical protein